MYIIFTKTQEMLFFKKLLLLVKGFKEMMYHGQDQKK